MKTEAETGGVLPQSVGHLQPPEAGRGHERCSHKLRREHGPADTLMLDFWPPALRGKEFLLLPLGTASLGNQHTGGIKGCIWATAA